MKSPGDDQVHIAVLQIFHHRRESSAAYRRRIVPDVDLKGIDLVADVSDFCGSLSLDSLSKMFHFNRRLPFKTHPIPNSRQRSHGIEQPAGAAGRPEY